MLRTAPKPDPCQCGGSCKTCRDPLSTWINRLDWTDTPDQWQSWNIQAPDSPGSGLLARMGEAVNRERGRA